MIRCLCTGAASLAQLLSPSNNGREWPPAVEAFLTGAATPPRASDDGRADTMRPPDA